MFRFFRKKSSEDTAAVRPSPVASPLEMALRESKFPEAIAILEEMAQADHNLNTLFLLLELKTLVEDFDGALVALEQMRQIDRNLTIYADFLALLKNARIWCNRQTVPGHSVELNAINEAPPAFQFSLMLAMEHHAQGQNEEAKNAIASAKAQMPKISGQLFFTDGKRVSFSDIYDTDDLTGPVFVCSTQQGLVDIPFALIAEIQFSSRESFPNAHWTLAMIRTRTGDEIPVSVFAYYVGTGRHESKEMRSLGMTTWDYSRGYRIGYGQRDLELEDGRGGRTLVGINQVGRIVFQNVTAPAE